MVQWPASWKRNSGGRKFPLASCFIGMANLCCGGCACIPHHFVLQEAFFPISPRSYLTRPCQRHKLPIWALPSHSWSYNHTFSVDMQYTEVLRSSFVTVRVVGTVLLQILRCVLFLRLHKLPTMVKCTSAQCCGTASVAWCRLPAVYDRCSGCLIPTGCGKGSETATEEEGSRTGKEGLARGRSRAGLNAATSVDHHDHNAVMVCRL